MRNIWLVVLLMIGGCAEVTDTQEQQEIKQPVEKIIQDITVLLERQQLVIGETEASELQDYIHLEEALYYYAGPYSVEAKLQDGIVAQVEVILPEPIKGELEDVQLNQMQGTWLQQDDKIVALELTREVPTLKQQVYAMPVEQKVGQLLMIGLQGTALTAEEQQALMHIGHVILFQKNIQSIEQLRTLMAEVDAVETPFPVWVGIDEEGGRVSRLPAELVPIPPAEQLAARYTLGEVEYIAMQVGKALSANGIDINFAPVMDVNNNPSNVVIGDRAFSDDPAVVASYANHFAKGLKRGNVIAVAKHFPGHGDTAIDSHVSLPMIEKPLASLEQIEFVPFRQAVAEGIDSIMLGHLLLPVLDTQAPASLSKKVVTLLREDWGYDGLLITDDLMMGALNMPLADAIAAAIAAGNDIALANGPLSEVQQGKERIVQAVLAGDIPLTQINESAYRVISRKKPQLLKPFAVEAWNNEMRALLQ